jgi:RimJ/RimL family protein N-acetyltransferase
VDPIEINAGAYYLRQLRADDLMDDRTTLRANGFPDPDAHIAARAEGWRADTDYTWGIADPPTGALLGEVGLTAVHDGIAQVMCWVAPKHPDRDIADIALASVRRFGFGALGLRDIGGQPG